MSARLESFSNGCVLPLVIVVLAFLAPPVAAGATAAELLEKAIYTEETVGNLDEAIKLYEQVIAEAKASRSAAAKAQYRVGLVYEKQGKPEQATAAFRAVVDNFADEAELVAQAKKRLPSEVQLLPAPWVDGEELQLNIKLATGIEVGTHIYRIEAAKHEKKDAWQCSTYGLVTANGNMSVSRVLCDKESFAPITSFWKHSMLGEANAVYRDDSVEIKISGKEDALTIKLAKIAFDNEQGVELFRRLPLKVGYKTTTDIVATLGAGRIELGLEVPEMETIEVPAGKFECFKLVLNIGQTFWISNDEHRYLVRFTAGGVTADLARIEQRKADAPEEVRGEGFSLTLPAGWHAYAPGKTSDEETQATHFLDPDAIVSSQVNAGPLHSLKEDERGSAQAWTESALKDLKKALKDFKLRDPGVQEVKVGDRAGTELVADFTDDAKKMTMYGVAVLSDKNAVNLRFKAPADKFDAVKPTFDAIVDSLKVK